jgi:hypothetical protein
MRIAVARPADTVRAVPARRLLQKQLLGIVPDRLILYAPTELR